MNGEFEGMKIKGHIVKGSVVDNETRCKHYQTERDRIAIKFFCCQTYFPCFLCHEEDGCGDVKVWPQDQFHHRAILCGACGTELTVHEYVQGENKCPNCRASFNPNCHLHENLYFDV